MLAYSQELGRQGRALAPSHPRELVSDWKLILAAAPGPLGDSGMEAVMLLCARFGPEAASASRDVATLPEAAELMAAAAAPAPRAPPSGP